MQKVIQEDFNIQNTLEEYLLYRLTKGRGFSAKGRSFYALYAFEFALENSGFGYRPKNLSDWLASLFIFEVAYKYSFIIETDDKQKLNLLLARPWVNFIDELTKLGLANIARTTNSHVEQTLVDLYSSHSDFGSFDVSLEQQSIRDVFLLLPSFEVPQKGGANFPVISNLRKKIAAILDPLWQDCLIEQDFNLNEASFIASLPPSGITTYNLIYDFTKQLSELDCICNYPFATFYMLLHDINKNRKLPNWQPSTKYLGDKEDIIRMAAGQERDDSSREKDIIKFGLVVMFPRAIEILDAWLEKSPFSHFYADAEAWCDVVTANYDAILDQEGRLHHDVLLKLPDYQKKYKTRQQEKQRLDYQKRQSN